MLQTETPTAIREKPSQPQPPGARRPAAFVSAGLALALLAPGLVVLGALFLYPLVVVLLSSLGWPELTTITYYSRFLADPRNYTAMVNTVQIAILSTVGSVVVSLPLAILLRHSPRYRTLIRTFITMPLMVPVLIAAYGLTLFFAQNGLFNYLVVELLHVVPERLRISYTLLGVVIACIWRYFPFVAIVVAAALESMDPSIEEAAAITGAGPLKVFRDITLPLLVPSILTGSILVFVGTFGTFSIPLIMGRGQDVLSVLAYRYHAVFFDEENASTVAVMMLVVQVVILTAYTRALGRRIA